MADLIRGRHPLTHHLWKITGGANQATQTNLAARTNAELTLLGGLTDAAALTSGAMTVVAVPVESGDIVTAIDVLVGATAATLPAQSWAALYAGTSSPTLLAQSTSGGTTAIAASGRLTFALASPVQVTTTTAPNGYLYAAVSVTATAVPTLISGTVPAAAQYRWFPTSPTALAGTAGSGLGATAPATLPAVTAQAAAPVVFLR